VQRVALSALALGLGAALAVPATAQTTSDQTMTNPPMAASSMPADTSAGPRAPDGSKAFGIEPYLGILGTYASFDNDSDFGSSPTNGSLNSWMITGVGGINIPLGPLFVGAEGNVSKGFSDIDWTYGVRGRIGFRAGETGMIFGTGGYQWIKVNNDRGFVDEAGYIVGMGVEVGPRDIGMGGVTGKSGPRLRIQVETFKFQSIQPSIGVIFHF
jgi:opacity protein-like surface antigen